MIKPQLSTKSVVGQFWPPDGTRGQRPETRDGPKLAHPIHERLVKTSVQLGLIR